MRHRILIRAFGVCSTIVAASGCATSALLEQELIKTNTQTVLAFEATVYNKHDVQEAFEHYVGDSFVEHDPRLLAPARRAGADPRQQAERAYRGLIAHDPAEAHRAFERTIAQGELVATQSLWYRGARSLAAESVVDIYRLREGRIVEHWDVVQPAGQETLGLRVPGLSGELGGDAVPGASLPP
jgi:predicted SnoaL-like aldol condensation-catalyzing enzyme